MKTDTKTPNDADRDFGSSDCSSSQDSPKTWDQIPGYLDDMNAKPWRFGFICQRPTRGSRWYRGNFTLGLMIDSHPRFVHLIVGLLFIEVGVSWEK